MPKRTDIHSVLIIGAGPIIIGQACEFDYSGTQACKALKEEGFRVILVNSNPATIITDPEFADRTYIEPITPECVEKIIVREIAEMKRLGATGKLVLLPTLGGQTALNTAMSLHRSGVLQKYGVEMIGANAEAIEKGEDRLVFKDLMLTIGLDVPISGVAHTLEECRAIAEKIGRFPLIIRPAFTLGGTGAGIAYNREEYEEICKRGMDLSPVNEILIEESLLGWKEFEMEVMRDKADNCVIICSIENFDPMGIHTGDSITVAPIQTLTDKEYQIMRDQSFAVIRAVGVETGGSNIQFAVNPDNGRMVIIEMNPRVSRSSALASKATGFPIAKIAAKLAVGYLLDEIRNDITRETPASFEPTIDYVVVKVPRFAFEKFAQADPTLNTQMKSVGEAMSIGRTFKESLQKCLRSLEIGRSGLGGDGKPWRIGTEVYGDRDILPRDVISRKLTVPNAERVFFIRHALRAGFTVEDIFQLTKIDRWFLTQMKEIVDFEEELAGTKKSYPVNKLIYIETTIPSFYTETRSDAEVRLRRKWTREWWHQPHVGQKLITSFVVQEELEQIPDLKRREAALQLIQSLEQFEFTPAVDEIVEVYLAHKLMPREGLGDAAHLALASLHRCSILVTWNCRHLANANKTDHIRRVNALLGLETPLLVTPLELIENDDETET